jgi:glyoxylase I family protein
MKSIGVHHVSVNVPDVDSALKFYTEVLGLTQRSDRPDFGFGGAWLNTGTQQIHLIEAPTPPDLGQHFAFRVEDMRAEIADLREAGVKVTDPIPVAKGHQAFLHDPFGNTIELFQDGPLSAA